MNILILSAAAKVLLVRAFGQAAHRRGGVVIAADLAPHNAALFEADRAVLVPPSDAPEFADVLVELCMRHDIKLVVPTRDGELAAVAAAKPRLAAMGVVALAPSDRALSVCHDKRRFVEFCQGLGLATPRTYAPGQLPDTFPVFVRPMEGAGGKGARIVSCAEDLPGDRGLLVQSLEAAPEYSIDVLMNLDGRPLQAVARRRLAVRDGEAVKSRVEPIAELTAQALKLCEALKLVGHNVVQAFYTPEFGPRFIEANPRFGGASNLSIRAGLNSPERIAQMVEGRLDLSAVPHRIHEGLTMLRYSEDRFVTQIELDSIAR